VAFSRRWSQDVVGRPGKDALALPGSKSFLHSTIFTRVEGENGNAPVRFKDRWQAAQKRIQSGKFVVYGDAKRLKDTANSQIELVFVHSWQRFANGDR